MFNINLPRVKERDPDLYYKLMDTFLVRETDGLAVLSIPEAKLNWLQPRVRQQVLLLEREFREEAEVEQQRKADVEAAERNRKIDADVAGYKARIIHYVQQGLENTRQNADVIDQWLKQYANGYYSAMNADAAVQILRTKLTWKPKEAPAPPPPVVVEEVRVLPNGEPELPLDATPTQMRRASTDQLRDLSKRRGEGKQTWRTGWTGANL